MPHLRSCRRRALRHSVFSGYAYGERKQIPLFSKTGRPIRGPQFELNGGIK